MYRKTAPSGAVFFGVRPTQQISIIHASEEARFEMTVLK